MTVELGITLPQFTDDTASILASARRAEELGLDSIWVFDHLWPLSGGKERPILECWSALAWLAAATDNITIGTMVTRSSLRNAALLAKMVATVGAIAPGRVVIAIGSGDEASRPENEAFGLPYYSGTERTQQLRDTVETVTATLRGETSIPVDPDLELPRVWVAGGSDATIAVACDLADGWNGWGGEPGSFAEACSDARSQTGPDFDTTWAGLVILAASDAAAHERLGGKAPGPRLVGGPEQVAGQLSRFAEAGASHLICTEVRGWDETALDLLAHEVRPRLT